MATAHVYGQSAIDAYRISQPDMKGTARYMSMGGAFGALGGDLSSISQNPAGIGVYRSNEFGFTVDLDIQSASSNTMGSKYDTNLTKFLLNNIGAVLTLKLPSTSCPNLNFGFTYNRSTTYNRKYGGNIPTLSNSMSNYIAGIANAENIVESELATTSKYDPYNPGYNEYAPPWLAVLGYDSYLMTPAEYSDGTTRWYGQWGAETKGSGAFLVNERGSVGDYNIVIGGNIANVVYWGMNFDITNLNYNIDALWGESMTNAYVPDQNNQAVRTSADWVMDNIYSVSGTGFQYQIGVIVKPIQELRLGLAFHTPTWYNLTETFGASVNYKYGDGEYGMADTNNGMLGYNQMSFRTPCKLIASAAGVIGSNFIISFDYEWTPYNKMKYSEAGSYGTGSSWDWDYGWGPGWDFLSSKASAGPATRASFLESNDPYYYTNEDIKNYYTATNTFRLGAEFRVTPSFSVRAGYCNVSSPVKSEMKNEWQEVYTSGTLPNYRWDNQTNYVSLGLGYRFNRFFVDLAYVYKHMTSEYHAYTPDTYAGNDIPSPTSKVSLSNNQVVLSAGFRF